jgi:CRP-like cAMP-binding protein
VAEADVPLLSLRREAHLFSQQPDLAARLALDRRVLPLAPDELLHAVTPAGYLVRRGRLRVTQLLPDGREITRAVLQAGAGLETLEGGASDPHRDTYPLADIILAAIGETELWQVPVGSFDLA